MTTYILLNLLLLFTSVIAGRYIQRGANYWSCAFGVVLAFTIVQGFRYGRGNDYMHYMEIFSGYSKQSNSLFSTINTMLECVGFTKYTVFIFYAFCFVTCGMWFLREYKECALFTFPLFIIGYIVFNEYQIRQAFSYSFFFLYLRYLFRIPEYITDIDNKDIKNIVWSGLFGLLCVSIHTANGIILAVVTLLYFLVHETVSYRITIPIYIASVYIIPNTFDFSYLKPLLSALSDIDTFSTYVENSDFWFSKEGANSIYLRNDYIQLFEVIGNVSLLYLGHIHVNDPNKEHFVGEKELYHSFFVGICILSAFRELELLNRIGYDISLLAFIFIGIILYCKNRFCIIEYDNKETTFVHETNTIADRMYIKNKDFYITPLSCIQTIAYFCLTWFLYDYLKYLLIPGRVTLFLWDVL